MQPLLAPAPEKRGEGRRQNLSVWSILACIFLPSFVFAWEYAIFCFKFRWMHLYWASLIGPGFALLLAVLTSYMTYSRLRSARPVRGLLALAVSLWVAAVSGFLLSDSNFWMNMSNYYSFQDLDTYVNIDPASDKGQTYMDAGQVYFKESTYVAAASATAFMNNGIYCAAPIVRQPLENQGGVQAVSAKGNLLVPASGTIDFWAVGIDCCNPSGQDFKCGEVGSDSKSRAGLRMLREDVRPFFALAVQEWAAGIGLPVRHPLFFYWVQDPLLEVDGYYVTGVNSFFMQLGIFFVLNAVGTCLIQVFLLKLGLP